jgi:hypothetical protein
VIPTDEELVMTEDAYALMNGTYDVQQQLHLLVPTQGLCEQGKGQGLRAGPQEASRAQEGTRVTEIIRTTA